MAVENMKITLMTIHSRLLNPKWQPESAHGAEQCVRAGAYPMEHCHVK